MKPFLPKTILTTLSLLAFSGCASKSENTVIFKDNDPVIQALLVSANSIEASLKKLANAEHYEKVEQRKRYTRVNASLPGLDKEVVMRWDGELEQAIKKLSQEAVGYRYLPPIGKKPIIPIMVSLPDEPRSLLNLIEGAALQAGNQADVVLDVQKKIIQVRYVQHGV